MLTTTTFTAAISRNTLMQAVQYFMVGWLRYPLMRVGQGSLSGAELRLMRESAQSLQLVKLVFYCECTHIYKYMFITLILKLCH